MAFPRVSLLCLLVAAGAAVPLGQAPSDAVPGVAAFVDVAGQLDDVFNLNLPKWCKLIETISIGDVQQSVDTPVGKIDLTLSSMKIESVDMDSVTTAGASSSTTSLKIAGLSAQLSLDWKFREHSWPHVSDHGSATATFSKGGLNGILGLALTGGNPTVSVPSLTADLGDFDIKIHSGWSWLYNILKGMIEGSIKSAAEKAIEKEVTQDIPKYANAYLAKLPKQVPVYIGPKTHRLATLMLDTSLMTIGESSTDVTLAAKGDLITPSACPHLPTSLSHAGPQNGTLATVAVDQSVLNCITWDMFTQDMFHYAVNNSMIPSGSPITLNTSDWTSYCPPLPQKYPNMNMTLDVSAVSEPFVSLAPGPLVNLSVPIYLNFSVVTPSGIEPAFTLQANFSTYADALDVDIIDGGYAINITGAIGGAALPVSIVSSAVGSFDVSQFETLLAFGAQIGAGAVNQKLGAGLKLAVPLPQQLALDAAGLSVAQGYFFVFSGIKPTE